MVRWVFRPYTQVRRSICTSEPLRASTSVSPGFALPRHSSPSFGSQPTCSNAIRLCEPVRRASPFFLLPKSSMSKKKSFRQMHDMTHAQLPCASKFATLTLARELDSLVRVSRRVGQVHFVGIIITRSIRHATLSPMTLVNTHDAHVK